MRRRDNRSGTFAEEPYQRSFSPWGPSGQRPQASWNRTTVAVLVGFAVFLVVVLTAVGLAVRWYSYHSTASTVPGQANGSRVVEVTAGMTASQIATLLQEQGIIANTADFLDLVTEHGTENKLQPRKYTFAEGLTLVEIVDMLEKGAGTAPYKVTIPEGMAISQVMARLDGDAKLSGTDYGSQVKQISQFELPYLAGVQVTEVSTLEGLLFPSTYFLSEEQSAAELIKQQLNAFRDKTAALPWINATDLKVSPYEIVIIASIIEKECRVAEERAMVARVIYNRLAQDMPLQMDATVRYALDKWTGDLTQADLGAISLQHPCQQGTTTWADLQPGRGDASCRA